MAAAASVAHHAIVVTHAYCSGRGRGGAYAGFDASAPTSRDGGKAEVVRRLMADKGYGTVVMVGDGATDMQVRGCDTPHAGGGHAGRSHSAWLLACWLAIASLACPC